MYELDDKVDDYKQAGVPLIWVINPNRRTATVIVRNETVRHLTEKDSLDGEQVVPGFRCLLAEILPPREPVSEAAPNGPGPTTEGTQQG